MFSRRYILWAFGSIFIIFFLWQIYLISIPVIDLFVGFPIQVNFKGKNSSNLLIPPIIHQTWKTKNLSNYPINNSHDEWKKNYPHYEIRLWTDDDLQRLVASDAYRFLKDIYHSYPFNIQRADLARLIVLHHQGGIYADLDVRPRRDKIDELRKLGASFIIPRSSSDSALINHFLASEPNSTVLDYILHQVSPNSWHRRIFILPYLQVFSTGSIFLMRTIRTWLAKHQRQSNSILVLTAQQTESFINHDAGRSWHLIDGFVLNQIDRIPLPSTSNFFRLLIFLLVFIIIYRLFPSIGHFLCKYPKKISFIIHQLRK